jgi:hypothetical protein
MNHIGEVQSLEMRNIDFHCRKFTVRGKRGDRAVLFSVRVGKALRRYLNGRDSGFVFGFQAVASMPDVFPRRRGDGSAAIAHMMRRAGEVRWCIEELGGEREKATRKRNESFQGDCAVIVTFGPSGSGRCPTSRFSDLSGLSVPGLVSALPLES